MADNRRGRERRFYFSRGQLFILATGVLIGSVIIFFLGMLIGKEIEGRKIGAKEEPLVKIPANPLLQESGPGGAASSKEELTFYDTLTKSPEAKSARKESVKESRRAEKPVKAEVKEAKSAAQERGREAERKLSASEAPKESVAAKPTETARVESKAEGGEALWSVQVNAFPDERSAQIWVDRLKNKGYKAYMVEGNIKGRSWYRVRVGRYGTREEAEKVEEQLKSRENLTKAFATSQ